MTHSVPEGPGARLSEVRKVRMETSGRIVKSCILVIFFAFRIKYLILFKGGKVCFG